MNLRAAILALASLCTAARGQAPDELSKLRDEHERDLAASTKVLDDNFRVTLRRIERERAAQGDYEGAQRVKDKLSALELPAASAQSATSKPGSHGAASKLPGYQLKAVDALLSNSASTDPRKEFIEFRKTGNTATWEISKVEPGTYEVFAVYSVGLPALDVKTEKISLALCGGSFSWSEVTSLAGRRDTRPLDKTVSPTASWDNYIRESIGRHEFVSRSATVRVEAVHAEAGGLMRLRRVDLVPLGAAGTGAGAIPADTAAALRELRNKNQEIMAGLLAPVREKFDAEFRQLEDELTKHGNPDGAAAAARERTKLLAKDGGE